MSAPDASAAVAEIQGLYGPFTFSEKLLQKIWAHGDYEPDRLQTVDGRRVRIANPGRWNLLGGPDFKEARVQLGAAMEQVMDVELHLREEDWTAHGHARDRAYDNVGLHVVLFPPSKSRSTLGAGGRAIPVVALLPSLRHDLEEYAAEEAVEGLANRPAARVLPLLQVLPAAELLEQLQTQARQRWAQKVHFAGQRVLKLGWTAACHQTALEILGYRFNRTPMLRLATQCPLERWRMVTTAGLEAWLDLEAGRWTLAGVRPANHPRQRLRQYAEWVRRCPDWPVRLDDLTGRLPTCDPAGRARDERRRHRVADWQRRFARDICGDALGGPRLSTLVCDGFLPLLATRRPDMGHGLWYHWPPGDLPSEMVSALRQAGVFSRPDQPVAQGPVQGLIGWLLAQEAGPVRFG